MPRLGRDSVDYNLAMNPKLLQAGKVVAASEDRKLAELLRYLLKQHIEKHGPEHARSIYTTAEEIPHGTPISRFGKSKDMAIQVPEVLFDCVKAQAKREERPVSSLMRRAIERYLEEAGMQVPEVPEDDNQIEGQTDIVSELEKLETEEVTASESARN